MPDQERVKRIKITSPGGKTPFAKLGVGAGDQYGDVWQRVHQKTASSNPDPASKALAFIEPGSDSEGYEHDGPSTIKQLIETGAAPGFDVDDNGTASARARFVEVPEEAAAQATAAAAAAAGAVTGTQPPAPPGARRGSSGQPTRRAAGQAAWHGPMHRLANIYMAQDRSGLFQAVKDPEYWHLMDSAIVDGLFSNFSHLPGVTRDKLRSGLVR